MAIFEVIHTVKFSCGRTSCTHSVTIADDDIPLNWGNEDERDELLGQFVPNEWFVIGCPHDGQQNMFQRRKCGYHRIVVCGIHCAKLVLDEIAKAGCRVQRQ